jgi:AcrR family transcriptional regulator
MPRKHDKEELLAHALTVAMRDGVDGVTFGAVGKEAGVPDRTVVYYFANKAALTEAVVGATALQILAALDGHIGGGRRLSDAELARECFEVLTGEDARGPVAVWLQVWSKAAGGEQPHLDISRGLVGTWIDWTSARLDPEPADETDARRRVAKLIALLDGALLLALVGLEDEARAALA